MDISKANQQAAAEIAVLRARLAELEEAHGEQQLAHYAQRLQAMHQVERSILTAQTPEKIAHVALRHLRELVPCRRVSVTLYDFENRTGTTIAASYDGKTMFKAGTRLQMDFGEGIVNILRQGEVMVVEDLKSLPEQTPIVQRLLAEGVRGRVMVPLIIEDELVGSVNLGLGHSGTLTAEQMVVAREVTDSLAVAIKHFRLHEAEREARALAEALSQTGAVLNSTLKLEEVLDRILDSASRVVAHDEANVMLIEGERDEATIDTYWRYDGKQGLQQVKLSRVFTVADLPELKLSVESGQPYVSSNTRTHGSWMELPRNERMRSYVGAPIHLKGELFGFLNLESATPDFFTARMADRLRAFANQAAIAINNAQLYETAQHERAMARTLQKSAEGLAISVHLGDTLTLIIDQLQQVIGFDRALVGLVERDNLRIAAVNGYANSDEMLGKVVRYPAIQLLRSIMASGESMALPDVVEHPDWKLMPGFDAATRSWGGVPLIAWDIVTGFLSISSDQPRAYSIRDLRVVRAFAQQAALAIETVNMIKALESTVSEVKEAHALLARTSRLAATAEMATGVAHQINNPLTTIVGQTYLLLKRLVPDSPEYEAASSIGQAAKQAGTIVQRLLDLSQSRSYSMVPVNINDSLQSAIALIMVQIELPTKLVVEMAPDLPLVGASPDHLGDVWSNLLLNARDAVAGREDGVIRVETALDDEQAAIVVTIKDNGSGIAAKDLEQVLNPFFTTKVRGQGTGLGLSICYDVVNRHGGRIELESEGVAGRGTVVRVIIPARGR